MPTICKVSLDAAEYKSDWAAVVSVTRAATAALEASFADASGAARRFDQSVADIADREIKVVASVETEEITAPEATAPVTVPVEADTAPALAAVETLVADIDDIPPAAVEADTAPALAAVETLVSDIDDIPPATVEADVVADTVEVARLKAEIAALEKVEIEAQVKVVDDDIALLQAELTAIRGDDTTVTVTTEADMVKSERLRAVIAQLQDKKIKIQTEVHSEPLDKLRGQLDTGTGKATSFGAAWRGMMQGSVGEQVSKGAGAIGAIGSAAGAAVPQLGFLGQAVSALTSPVSMIIALLSALVAVGVTVWDTLTVSTDEYAARAKLATEAADRELQKTREKDTATGGYITRLRELSTVENAGNSVRAETASILSTLGSRYGDLGAEIDATTGRVTNLLAVEERLNSERRKELAGKMQKAADSSMDEARAAYIKTVGNEYLMREEQAAPKFDAMREVMSIEDMAAMMDSRGKNATTAEAISGSADVAAKLRKAAEMQRQSRSMAATGYATQDERDKAEQQRAAEAATAQRARDAARAASAASRSDAAFSDLKDVDAKKENRRSRITAEQGRRGDLQQRLDESRTEADKAGAAGNAEAKAAALKKVFDLERQIVESKNAEFALERQIADLEKAQAEAVNKLTSQAAYELEYGKLITAGEYDKAAALQLEKELRESNLRLSADETAELLKQRAALAAQNLQKNLQGQAYDLYGQAMTKAGKGKEFAEEKAIRDARTAKGRDLTGDEEDMVKKLSSLSYGMTQQRDAQYGDMSIKTNALTARGGFAGGAKAPDTDKVNREIAQTSKKQLATAEQIKNALIKIGEMLEE